MQESRGCQVPQRKEFHIRRSRKTALSPHKHHSPVACTEENNQLPVSTSFIIWFLAVGTRDRMILVWKPFYVLSAMEAWIARNGWKHQRSQIMNDEKFSKVEEDARTKQWEVDTISYFQPATFICSGNRKHFSPTG